MSRLSDAETRPLGFPPLRATQPRPSYTTPGAIHNPEPKAAANPCPECGCTGYHGPVYVQGPPWNPWHPEVLACSQP
jgi:hypothetical protein